MKQNLIETLSGIVLIIIGFIFLFVVSWKIFVGVFLILLGRGILEDLAEKFEEEKKLDDFKYKGGVDL